MNDTIYRQAAIDKINERQRKLIYCFGFENDMVKIMDIAKSIITTIPSAQPEQRWIPCSERLPETDEEGYSEKVLVCYSNYSGMDICEYRIDKGIGKWYLGDLMDSPEDLGINVIAWMPLPKRWEGGQECTK